jgi:hypothetical protein
MTDINLRTLVMAGLAAAFTDPAFFTRNAPEVAYLHDALVAVRDWEGNWQQALERYRSEPNAIDKPLLELAIQYRLARIELMSVVLAAAVEDELMVGRVLAYVQAPVAGSRPTVGLMASAFGEGRLTASVSSHVYALSSGPAVRSGLLVLSGAGVPLPEQHASVPNHLCLALVGSDSHFPGTTLGLGNMPAVPLPATILEEASRQVSALDTGSVASSSETNTLILRSGSPSEGRSVAAAMAQALGQRPLYIETDQVAGLSPWLSLRQLLPVHCFELAPGERKSLPQLPFYYGPILVVSGPDGSVETPSGAALSWSLPVPPSVERQRLWAQALGETEAAPAEWPASLAGAPPSLSQELARYHRHGSGRIAHLGRLAHQRCRLAGRDHPVKDDLVAVSWVGEGAGLEALAQPLTDPVLDEAVVTTPDLSRDLDILLVRCRNRDNLVLGLGVSATTRYHPGVRALFVGPSGTGKTLAAGWLATRLGLPLYRVDLAAVTSKYIGETEKNLAQLLARAEQSEVILLFDEADSLFGKRTDVKEANDRFANAQTNYLLQRIETFDGITLLTSNSRGRFDPAFSRRLDLIVDFPLPGPEERRQLWESHLGNGHSLTARQINQLALAVDLTGGSIRNVVLTAAVLTKASGRKIGWAEIQQGLATEYSKVGRQVPTELK